MRVVLLAAAAAFLATAAGGKLVDVTLADFLAQVSSGCIVRIARIESHVWSGSAPPEEFRTLNQRAIGDVAQDLDRLCGLPLGSEIEFLFSTELHSAHPRPGDLAVVFLTDGAGEQVEAVYGRSYWRIVDRDEGQSIEVTRRNGFLMAPVELQAGEVAHLPLTAVQRLLRSDRATTRPEKTPPQ